MPNIGMKTKCVRGVLDSGGVDIFTMYGGGSPAQVYRLFYTQHLAHPLPHNTHAYIQECQWMQARTAQATQPFYL
jgi:hypothetical protein